MRACVGVRACGGWVVGCGCTRTVWACARVGLLMQYATHRRHSARPLWLQCIFRHYLKNNDFRKKVTEYKKCIFIFSTTFMWNISYSKKKPAGYYHICENVFMLFLSDFNDARTFPDIFSKKSQISSLIKIRPVGAHLFHVDRQTGRLTDGWTDTIKLIVAFRNIANAPKT